MLVVVSVDVAGFSCVRRCGSFAGRGVGRCAGLFVVVFGVGGGWLFVCSMMWARLLAENWVDSLAVVGVDGVFHKRVR